jgi:hypothetical protein
VVGDPDLGTLRSMLDEASSDLESMLSRAATAKGWARVIQRCAWCQRVFDERGVGDVLVLVDERTVVTTDGMCPPCGRRNLALLASRRSPRTLEAA